MKISTWFFSVTDVDSANNAIAMASQTAITLAGIQAIVIVFLSLLNPLLAINLFDSLFMVSLGLILKNKPSRLIALILFLYSILTVYTTIKARLGISTEGFAGTNIILAIMFFYAGYKDVQGTFGYHRVHNTKIIIKNIFFLSVIIFGYSVLITIIYFSVISILQFEPMLQNMSEDLVAGVDFITRCN